MVAAPSAYERKGEAAADSGSSGAAAAESEPKKIVHKAGTVRIPERTSAIVLDLLRQLEVEATGREEVVRPGLAVERVQEPKLEPNSDSAAAAASFGRGRGRGRGSLTPGQPPKVAWGELAGAQDSTASLQGATTGLYDDSDADCTAASQHSGHGLAAAASNREGAARSTAISS